MSPAPISPHPVDDAAPGAVEPTSDMTCSVCPHPWLDHDALGRRFCTATRAAALTRGCICRPAAQGSG